MLFPADLYIALLSAPPGGGGQGSGGGGIATLLPPILIMFAIFYFLMIRPQRKKEQERQSMIKALKKGDVVYTHSGIIGKVRNIDGREIVLDLEEKNRMRILREAVAGIYNKKADDAVVEVTAEQSQQMTEATKS